MQKLHEEFFNHLNNNFNYDPLETYTVNYYNIGLYIRTAKQKVSKVF